MKKIKNQLFTFLAIGFLVSALTNIDVLADGNILNILCWQSCEFPTLVEQYYPGYQKTSDTSGMIGSTTVNWIIKEDNAVYRGAVDAALQVNSTQPEDSRIDLFLVEASYAPKYMQADGSQALPLLDLGISDADLSGQFAFTKELATGSDGQQRGASWQACAGGLIYNRQIAKQVLGTDDPAAVQSYVSDWDTFNMTAKQVAAYGYKMISSVMESYRVYYNNISRPWVVHGGAEVDGHLTKWAEDSKELIAYRASTDCSVWSDEWAQGFYPNGRVFGYFGPIWLLNKHLPEEGADSVSNQEGWAFTQGPQPYFWGGSWICAANGTDNPALARDIILKLTTDEGILFRIASETMESVNNMNVMQRLSTDPNQGMSVLGWQNPWGIMKAIAETISSRNVTEYDPAINSAFQNAMKEYFAGNVDYRTANYQFENSLFDAYQDVFYFGDWIQDMTDYPSWLQQEMLENMSSSNTADNSSVYTEEEVRSAVYNYVDWKWGSQDSPHHGYHRYEGYDANNGLYQFYVRSYTGAHATLYVYEDSGEMYEAWTNPITDEIEPTQYAGNIVEYVP